MTVNKPRDEDAVGWELDEEDDDAEELESYEYEDITHCPELNTGTVARSAAARIHAQTRNARSRARRKSARSVISKTATGKLNERRDRHTHSRLQMRLR